MTIPKFTSQEQADRWLAREKDFVPPTYLWMSTHPQVEFTWSSTPPPTAVRPYSSHVSVCSDCGSHVLTELVHTSWHQKLWLQGYW